MSAEAEYIPFGPEWEREVMKLTKAQIIEILRTALMKQAITSTENEKD